MVFTFGQFPCQGQIAITIGGPYNAAHQPFCRQHLLSIPSYSSQFSPAGPNIKTLEGAVSLFGFCPRKAIWPTVSNGQSQPHVSYDRARWCSNRNTFWPIRINLSWRQCMAVLSFCVLCDKAFFKHEVSISFSHCSLHGFYLRIVSLWDSRRYTIIENTFISLFLYLHSLNRIQL